MQSDCFVATLLAMTKLKGLAMAKAKESSIMKVKGPAKTTIKGW